MYEKLKKLISELDDKLTNGTHAMNQWRNDNDVMEFLAGGREYYLSDGGYSRIIRSWNTGKLFLTSNSLQKCKENWKRNTDLIQKIEKELEKLFPIDN